MTNLNEAKQPHEALLNGYPLARIIHVPGSTRCALSSTGREAQAMVTRLCGHRLRFAPSVGE